MKSRNHAIRITAALLCLVALATAGFAKTNPLSYPRGLAVDAKGNLWVANSGDNNILEFTPGYALHSAGTITQGVSNPTGVAFDLLGNLWVTNYGGGGSVTEYTAGQQVTASTITNGILGPEAIAIDGLGNILVENGFTNVTVYSQQAAFAAPSLSRTINLNQAVYGITVAEGNFAIGTNNGVFFGAETVVLNSGTLCCQYNPGDTGSAIAADSKGDMYIADINGMVTIEVPPGEYAPILQLPFSPSGIAIDSVRSRIYVSNYNGNSISVYSTSSALLKVIE
jgi:DNA-binding beta-propeller fold protein YncE